MTLLERAQHFAADVNQLQVAEQSRDEFEALQERLAELSRLRDAMAGARDKVLVFRKATLEVGFTASLIIGARNRVEGVLGAFKAAPVSKTLVTGRGWVQLIGALEAAAEAVNTSCRGAWRQFVLDNRTSESLTELDQKAVPTPDNEKLLGECKKKYSRLDDLLEQQAMSVEQIEEIRRIKAEIRSILAKVQLDAPAEITRFLNMARSPGGSPLTALTPSIFQWLDDHDMLSRFVIRRSS